MKVILAGIPFGKKPFGRVTDGLPVKLVMASWSPVSGGAMIISYPSITGSIFFMIWYRILQALMYSTAGTKREVLKVLGHLSLFCCTISSSFEDLVSGSKAAADSAPIISDS